MIQNTVEANDIYLMIEYKRIFPFLLFRTENNSAKCNIETKKAYDPNA